MCTNKKKVWIASRHSYMWVNCGKCPACQMEKANARMRRLKNAYSQYQGYGPTENVLFVTLTYAPNFLPYIRPTELKENQEYINIYRDYDCKRVRKGSSYVFSKEPFRLTSPISKIDCLQQKIFYDGERLPLARGSHNKVGILFYKDVQDFYKRLERYLYRHFGITNSDFKRYTCGELGETYFRPHFHLLLYIPSHRMDEFYEAIRASWAYDNDGLARQIEVARSPSSYVSRYLCRPSDFPRFFENRCFRPKSSFSKGFGTSNPSFTLPSLLEAIDRGDMRYLCISHKNGKSSPALLFYPKYFIDRYFVKFKGFSRFSCSEMSFLLQKPNAIFSLGFKYGYSYEDDKNDYLRTFNIIRLRFRRFCEESGLTGRVSDLAKLFSYYYYKCWSVYNSTLLRALYDSVNSVSDYLELYDNLDEVREFGFVPNFLSFNDVDNINNGIVNLNENVLVSNPNLFHKNMARTQELTDSFYKHMKQKKVNNHVYRTEKGMLI